jgi:hypothetical protein
MPASYTRPTQRRAWGELAPAEMDTRARRRGAIQMAEAGEPVFACVGLPVCHYDTPAYKNSISTWKHDLLYYYLVKKRSMPLGRYFRGRWRAWENAWRHRTAAPKEPPKDRHDVYRLLVNSPEGKPADELLSRIPWNQLGYGWKTALGGGDKNEHACSEVVRFFFDRYMKLEQLERYPLLKNRSDDFDKTRVKNACDMLATRLSQHKPTSIAICWPSTSNRRERLDPDCIKHKGWPHVLGIVACDGSKKKFLALEPWPDNTIAANYGSIQTSFLAVIEYKEYGPAKAVLEYTNGVAGVKGSCVLTLHAF